MFLRLQSAGCHTSGQHDSITGSTLVYSMLKAECLHKDHVQSPLATIIIPVISETI